MAFGVCLVQQQLLALMALVAMGLVVVVEMGGTGNWRLVTAMVLAWLRWTGDAVAAAAVGLLALLLVCVQWVRFSVGWQLAMVVSSLVLVLTVGDVVVVVF